MSRAEALIGATAVGLAALAVRIWAAAIVVFPLPEDTAYYVGVARNFIEGRGLVSDALWSYATPPLEVPRAAFEVWLPLPTFLAALPMSILGATFEAAQWSSVLVGVAVAVLAWRLGADLAAERNLPAGRAQTLAIGAGLTAAVSLPLVLASSEPDSTGAFTALALAACLLMPRIARAPRGGRVGDLRLIVLGLVLGLAALTRNDAAWLALVWVVLAWRLPGASRGERLRLIGVPAVIALIVFAPWGVRDWQAFGSPFPGQALSNALSLDGRDIFAWQDRPTLARYLAAGPATLTSLRVTGFVHNLVDVILLPGIPVSVVGLVALFGLTSIRRSRTLRPVALVGAVVFAVDTLVFPVSTTWGTFLHAAGPIHVLLLVAGLVGLDAAIAAIGRLRGWTRPVAWLGPTLTIFGGAVVTVALLPGFGMNADMTRARFEALGPALRTVDMTGLQAGPVITDAPIWLAETARIRTLALPNEPPTSVLDLARRFGAKLLVVDANAGGAWPGALSGNDPAATCFRSVDLHSSTLASSNALGGTRVFVIECP